METSKATLSLAQIIKSDTRFAAFLSAPHKDTLGLANHKLFPRSSGFFPADVPHLTALACAVKYDHTVKKHRGIKRLLPLHALHALIRLGPASLSAAQAIARRCLLTRDDAPAEHLEDEDYITERLLPALSGTFLAMGCGAIGALQGRLMAMARNPESLVGHVQGAKVLITAHSTLAVLSGNLETAFQAASVVTQVLSTLLDIRKSTLEPMLAADSSGRMRDTWVATSEVIVRARPFHALPSCTRCSAAMQLVRGL